MLLVTTLFPCFPLVYVVVNVVVLVLITMTSCKGFPPHTHQVSGLPLLDAIREDMALVSIEAQKVVHFLKYLFTFFRYLFSF